MPDFQPDQVGFGDQDGYGIWDNGHGREHATFVAKLAGQSPAVNIPDFPLLSFLSAGNSRNAILQSHIDAHNILRSSLNISGVDYSGFNLDDKESFYDFINWHRVEHTSIRQALGLT